MTLKSGSQSSVEKRTWIRSRRDPRFCHTSDNPHPEILPRSKYGVRIPTFVHGVNVEVRPTSSRVSEHEFGTPVVDMRECVVGVPVTQVLSRIRGLPPQDFTLERLRRIQSSLHFLPHARRRDPVTDTMLKDRRGIQSKS